MPCSIYFLINKHFRAHYTHVSGSRTAWLILSHLLSVFHLKRVFFQASIDGQMIIEYIKKIKFFLKKSVKSVKPEGRMEDEDTGSRLPFVICLEDSNVSVNITRIMLSELTTRNDRSVYCAYSPVSKTLPENYTSLRCRRKENRIRDQEKTGQWTIQWSTITAVTSGSTWSISHLVTYFVFTTAQGVGTVSYLIRQRKLRYIET